MERHAKSADRKEIANYYKSASRQVLHIEERSLQRIKSVGWKKAQERRSHAKSWEDGGEDASDEMEEEQRRCPR
jgi:hypothetical protein